MRAIPHSCKAHCRLCNERSSTTTSQGCSTVRRNRRGSNGTTCNSLQTSNETMQMSNDNMSQMLDNRTQDVCSTECETHLSTMYGKHMLESQPLTSSVSQADVDEDIDWSSVEEIRHARKLLIRPRQVAKTEDFPIVRATLTPGMRRVNVNVVVDTNILMDNLETLRKIMHLHFNDKSYPVIYVPWTVRQELDYFKNGDSVSELHPMSKTIQVRCRKAIEFINNCHQSQEENCRISTADCPLIFAVIGTHGPDDSIVRCCLQLQLERFAVILLSSDINIRNKAMKSNVKSCAPSEIIKLLCKDKVIVERLSFANKISKELSTICSFLLHFEIQDYLGERLYVSKLFKPLPWTFKDCVIYMRQYYDSVLAPKVNKRCRKHVNDLYKLLTSGEEITNSLKFMESCVLLLICLQTGFPKYNENIQRTINMITSLKDAEVFE